MVGLLAFYKKIMKNKTLPISIILVFGIIFFIFYKGLEDSNIYTQNVNIKNEIQILKNKWGIAVETNTSLVLCAESDKRRNPLTLELSKQLLKLNNITLL